MSSLGALHSEVGLFLRDCSETALLDSELIITHVLDINKNKFIRDPDSFISEHQENSIWQLARKRKEGQSIAHIVGKKEFWGNDFEVYERVLVPRPESESLIEAVLGLFPDKMKYFSVLELGLGSGCLLITLLLHYKNSIGYGCEKDVTAYHNSCKNMEKFNLNDRTGLFFLDWKDIVSDFLVDLIISNPPYINSTSIKSLSKEVRLYESHEALDGGLDGLNCYRQVIDVVHRFLKPQGFLVLELGKGQLNSVVNIARRKGLITVSSKRDLIGIERVVIFKKIGSTNRVTDC